MFAHSAVVAVYDRRGRRSKSAATIHVALHNRFIPAKMNCDVQVTGGLIRTSPQILLDIWEKG